MSAFRTLVLAAASVAVLSSTSEAKTVRHPKPARVPDGIQVPMDNVSIVTFRNPVTTVFIGNPSIANVTMIDSLHAFVLGKRFGGTNLIALRGDKTVIENIPVVVSARFAGDVTIFRGSSTFNYACSASHCEAGPVPGDPKTYYDNTAETRSEHNDEAIKGASPTGQIGR